MIVDQSSKSISNVAGTIERVKAALEETEAVLESVPNEIKGIESTDVSDEDLDKLLKQDRLIQWMEWAVMLDTLAKQGQSALAQNKAEKVVSCAKNMADATLMLNSSSCSNLRLRARKAFEAFISILMNSLETKIEATLVKLNFPQCIVNEDESLGKLNTDRDDHVLAFKMAFLLMIELCKIASKVDPEIKCHDPNSYLLDPIIKRFKFHFCGKKKTNNLVRPEWFLQQVKLWLANSKQFYQNCVSDSFKLSSMASLHHSKFCSGVFEAVRDKLRHDLALVLDDDHILSHMIDEVLIFSKDVHDLDFTNNVPEEVLPSSVLTDSEVFKRWLSLERKFAFEKIDSILEGDEGWLQSPSDPEIFKSVETFVALLVCLTNRFKLISYTEQHSDFVDLQCDLAEDFRMRLVQLLRQESVNERYGLALNSAHHLVCALETWSDTPVYLHLSYLLKGETSGDQGVFSDVIDGFHFLIKDSTKNIAKSIVYEVKAQSFAYRKTVAWSSKEPSYDVNSPCPEALGMFQALASNLHAVMSKVKRVLFQDVIDFVICDLGHFFVYEVILENRFSPEGVQQIKTDVNKGIMPILRQLSETSVLNNALLKEVLDVMGMQLAKAVLMRESLLTCDRSDLTEVMDILKEMNLSTISVSLALQVLNKRTDLPLDSS